MRLNSIYKMKGEYKMFNYENLEKRINNMFGVAAFGKLIGMDEQEIKSKLENISEFTMAEIEKAAEILNISPEEIPAYFFEV